jgi:hypothetical protein
MEFTVVNDEGETIGTYISEFNGSTFKVYVEVDSDQVLAIDQPWNPTGDGKRVPWESEEQAIAWFKKSMGV